MTDEPRTWQSHEWDPEVQHFRKTRPVRDWRKIAPNLSINFAQALLSKWQEAARIHTLEKQILLLQKQVARLQAGASAIIPVLTFAPEPYEVLTPFQVVVRACGDEYIASFFDANISASGETQEEAVYNLKDVIITVFETLTEQGEARLGVGPARQLKVLTQFLKRSS
jgi:predicted RNase H-like HicB family nuclease